MRRCPVDLKLFVNMAGSPAEAQAAVDRIRLVARKFLRVEIDDFGYMLADEDVPAAARRQEAFVLSQPEGAAARSIAALAGRVSANNRIGNAARGLGSFFGRLAEAGPQAATAE